MFLYLFLLIFSCFLNNFVFSAPTPAMCSSFARFTQRWNPDPGNLLVWVQNKVNCDKIQPRPEGMSCADVVQFVADCNFPSSSTSSGALGPRNNYNYPSVLNRYVYCNAQTARDYSQFGNFYYPNCYPPTYLGNYDGRPGSIAQLENDYSLFKGGNYPYNRADNIVNQSLQQTWLPTCLHDLFYCLRAQAAQRQGYQKFYEEEAAKRRFDSRLEGSSREMTASEEEEARQRLIRKIRRRRLRHH